MTRLVQHKSTCLPQTLISRNKRNECSMGSNSCCCRTTSPGQTCLCFLSQKAAANEDCGVHSAVSAAHAAPGAAAAARKPGRLWFPLPRRHKGRIVASAVTAGGRSHKRRPMRKQRGNNGILLFSLLVWPLHCAPSSMGLFLALQLVFSQTPLAENGQASPSAAYEEHCFINCTFETPANHGIHHI